MFDSFDSFDSFDMFERHDMMSDDCLNIQNNESVGTSDGFRFTEDDYFCE